MRRERVWNELDLLRFEDFGHVEMLACRVTSLHGDDLAISFELFVSVRLVLAVALDCSFVVPWRLVIHETVFLLWLQRHCLEKVALCH